MCAYDLTASHDPNRVASDLVNLVKGMARQCNVQDLSDSEGCSFELAASHVPYRVACDLVNLVKGMVWPGSAMCRASRL
jgi:hypothetical protein